jgi:hypothetical protein
MIHISAKQKQDRLKQLQRQRDIANEAFLNALTYVRPFEEVRKLFLELKAIETELTTLNLKKQTEGIA